DVCAARPPPATPTATRAPGRGAGDCAAHAADRVAVRLVDDRALAAGAAVSVARRALAGERTSADRRRPGRLCVSVRTSGGDLVARRPGPVHAVVERGFHAR